MGKGAVCMDTNIFLTEMGVRIAKRRKELRFTQEQLAEAMGVSLQTVSCIELGKKAIRPENLVKLCVCLDVSTDYILCGRRSVQQMDETISKLASLPPEDFRALQNLVEILYKKMKESAG